MGCGRLKVECEDGFEVVTKDHKELVATVGWHLKNTHHKDLPEAEIMNRGLQVSAALTKTASRSH